MFFPYFVIPAKAGISIYFTANAGISGHQNLVSSSSTFKLDPRLRGDTAFARCAKA